MKVLWITNILFPEAERLLTGIGELKSSGGWMLGAADALLQDAQTKLYVATVSPLVSDLSEFKGEKITYYVLPIGKGNKRYNKSYEEYWKQVKAKVQPDVVHIHGTECSHGLAYVNACGSDNVVVSIQGMKSSYYYYYYYYGLTKSEIISNITIRDILRGNIFSQQQEFRRSGELEKELISKVSHIIGRTSWDRDRCWAINPKAEYHFCNETLRRDFYEGEKWSYDRCCKHSIFISQASYPIKGLHQLLRAMPLILSHYPDTMVRVGGFDITNPRKIAGISALTGYGQIINKLIKEFNLDGKVTFLGNLNAEQMKREYLLANVFVCPSTIENSPNSLGEAQILGVPSVASYVGGIPDMMKGDEEHLYRFEETEMLAYIVCDCFAHSREATTENMLKIASQRHDPTTNANVLKTIYDCIINS